MAKHPGIARRKREKWTYVHIYKANHGCQDCGEADPVVLELDHVRGEKVKKVTRMINDDLSIARLNAELEKCEVVCAN